MAEPDVPDYSWLSDPVRRPEAMCITVATGVSPEEALLAFGADPDAEPVALADLVDGEEPSVAVIPLDGAVVAIEDNGWQGSRREVLRSLSARGPASAACTSRTDLIASPSRTTSMTSSWQGHDDHRDGASS